MPRHMRPSSRERGLSRASFLASPTPLKNTADAEFGHRSLLLEVMGHRRIYGLDSSLLLQELQTNPKLRQAFLWVSN